MWAEALALLDAAERSLPCATIIGVGMSPRAGQRAARQQRLREAAAQPVDLCFPNRLDDVLALEAAMQADPQDSHAPYLLGVFWYAHRRYEEAIACWERARKLDDSFPTVDRNLGLAYSNKRHDPAGALAAYAGSICTRPAQRPALL